jgi:hypothetical protein
MVQETKHSRDAGEIFSDLNIRNSIRRTKKEEEEEEEEEESVRTRNVKPKRTHLHSCKRNK